MKPQLSDPGDDLSAHDVDVLARSVSALVRERGGVLVALTVGLPTLVDGRAFMDGAEFKELLERRLSIAGLDLVDVSIVHNHGPPRIVAAEFER